MLCRLLRTFCRPAGFGLLVASGLWISGLGITVLGISGLAPAASAQERTPAAARARRTPPALREYMGRPIAQTMHYLGAEWLTRDNREQQERCSLMLANLGVKRGMAICDMGCGNGFYTLQMAKITGDEGHVYAIDIQPEMLKFLNDRADEAGLDNISPILGTFTNPRLPKGKIDLILLVDVYHEFSHPEQMLAAMRESLSPDGVCVLVEFRGEDPKVPIKPEHKMSREQIMKEWPKNGFKLVKEFDGLPWQHMLWFGRDDRPDENDGPAKLGGDFQR
jgi:2-polyprenyl-3-methyl-5-hydroxy-6-metoxy-1,4-benzoquinol methylase